MPFHVLVTWTGQGRGIALNWSDSDVRHRIVEPYEAGRPLVVQGQQFDPRLSRVQILDGPQAESDRPTLEAWNRLLGRSKIVTDHFLTRVAGGGGATAESAAGEGVHGAVDPRTVMVVYGRDEAVTAGMFELLRALDLKPLEWGQLVALTGEGSPYIGDVLEQAFNIAQAAVVIFTPDDEARLAERLWKEETDEDEKRLVGQARPNVFFEAGLAFGAFPARTIMVEIGDQRQASDLLGRHAIRLDNSPERRNDLAERLAQAGCPVDRAGSAWVTAGEFAKSERSAGGDATPSS